MTPEAQVPVGTGGFAQRNPQGTGAAGSLAPLEGVRVVEFCSNLAGPFGAMILAQLGADVVKVEPPAGDDARHYASSMVDGVSTFHAYVNAGKRGVVLDLKQPDDRETALALIATADVVLQSFRPGVADRLGIGEEVVHELAPDALFYDVNAFGTGPVGAAIPGYDPLVQAFSGIMEMTGHDGTPPTRCAPSIIDLGTGQWVALGVLAALMSRQAGAPVRTIETALVDTAFSLVAYQATAASLSGERPPRAGSGNPIASPYQCYEASDGHVLIAAANQRLWERIVGVLEAPALLDDERFASNAERSANRAALEDEMNAVMRARPAAEWIELLTAEGVPAGPVNGLEQAITGDVARERSTLVAEGAIPLVRLPLRADGADIPRRRPAPGLGEHTDEILAELGRPTMEAAP